MIPKFGMNKEGYVTIDEFYNTKPEEGNYVRELLAGEVVTYNFPHPLYTEVRDNLIRILEDYTTNINPNCRLVTDYYVAYGDINYIKASILLFLEAGEGNELEQAVPGVAIDLLLPEFSIGYISHRMAIYTELGFKEYWQISTENKYVTVYSLESGSSDTYFLDNTLVSTVLPGLTIDGKNVMELHDSNE